MTLERYRNPDGKTFNGVALLAELSGLSQAEIAWTAARLKELMTVQRVDREVAKRMVKLEATLKPWETHKGSSQ